MSFSMSSSMTEPIHHQCEDKLSTPNLGPEKSPTHNSPQAISFPTGAGPVKLRSEFLRLLRMALS
jgi:hypothetical protein